VLKDPYCMTILNIQCLHITNADAAPRPRLVIHYDNFINLITFP
jgi:hypothetical protein